MRNRYLPTDTQLVAVDIGPGVADLYDGAGKQLADDAANITAGAQRPPGRGIKDAIGIHRTFDNCKSKGCKIDGMHIVARHLTARRKTDRITEHRRLNDLF